MELEAIIERAFALDPHGTEQDLRALSLKCRLADGKDVYIKQDWLDLIYKYQPLSPRPSPARKLEETGAQLTLIT